jgi:steroid 5-alpha reductase family enzyme
MTAARVLLGGWAGLAALFALLWAVQVRTRDASHVDAGWAAGLGLLALACAALLPGAAPRRALVAAMAAVWSVRLAAHLYFDRVRGKPEDGRYASLRASWGAAADRNFFFFFQAQGALDVLLALPFAALCARSGPLGASDALGAALWLSAVGGEAAADRQLAAFRARPDSKGRVCREGLWRYSRHPNYFFEWAHWLSYAAMAPADWRVWTSPALMLFFLLRVTGIPATEAQALKSRGDAYRDYQRTTSMFVPWFPRRTPA